MRRATAVVASILVGAVISAVIASAAAVLAGLPSSYYYDTTVQLPLTAAETEFVSAQYANPPGSKWEATEARHFGLTRRGLTRTEAPQGGLVTIDVYAFFDVGSSPVCTTFAGWPFRCFWSVEYDAAITSQSQGIASSPRHVEGGFMVPVSEEQGRKGALPRPVPFRPLWLGLLADSMLFGALTLAAGCVATILVRWSRYRRGRCWRCGHSAAPSAVCPECGESLWTPRST